MTYRTSAEPARSVVVRRIPSGDSFRWFKLVLGVLFVVGATIAAWVGTWSSVRCVDDRCAVVQWKMLRGAREYPFDPRSAPPIVLEPARVGKSGTGLRLLLRYPSGDVEILRDWPSQTEAEARRMRAYFADPRGALLVEGKRDIGPYLLVGILGLLGLLMALDGAKVLVWHRLRADPRAHTVTLETMVLGATVARRAFAVSAATRVGTAPARPEGRRVRLEVLTLEEPEKEPRELPIYARDATRPVVEAMVEAAA